MVPRQVIASAVPHWNYLHTILTEDEEKLQRLVLNLSEIMLERLGITSSRYWQSESPSDIHIVQAAFRGLGQGAAHK